MGRTAMENPARDALRRKLVGAIIELRDAGDPASLLDELQCDTGLRRSLAAAVTEFRTAYFAGEFAGLSGKKKKQHYVAYVLRRLDDLLFSSEPPTPSLLKHLSKDKLEEGLVALFRSTGFISTAAQSELMVVLDDHLETLSLMVDAVDQFPAFALYVLHLNLSKLGYGCMSTKDLERESLLLSLQDRRTLPDGTSPIGRYISQIIAPRVDDCVVTFHADDLESSDIALAFCYFGDPADEAVEDWLERECQQHDNRGRFAWSNRPLKKLYQAASAMPRDKRVDWNLYFVKGLQPRLAEMAFRQLRLRAGEEQALVDLNLERMREGWNGLEELRGSLPAQDFLVTSDDGLRQLVDVKCNLYFQSYQGRRARGKRGFGLRGFCVDARTHDQGESETLAGVLVANVPRSKTLHFYLAHDNIERRYEPNVRWVLHSIGVLTPSCRQRMLEAAAALGLTLDQDLFEKRVPPFMFPRPVPMSPAEDVASAALGCLRELELDDAASLAEILLRMASASALGGELAFNASSRTLGEATFLQRFGSVLGKTGVEGVRFAFWLASLHAVTLSLSDGAELEDVRELLSSIETCGLLPLFYFADAEVSFEGGRGKRNVCTEWVTTVLRPLAENWSGLGVRCRCPANTSKVKVTPLRVRASGAIEGHIRCRACNSEPEYGTLITHCRECDHFPLVAGEAPRCECTYLVCPACGSCGAHCGHGAKRVRSNSGEYDALPDGFVIRESSDPDIRPPYKQSPNDRPQGGYKSIPAYEIYKNKLGMDLHEFRRIAKSLGVYVENYDSRFSREEGQWFLNHPAFGKDRKR